jgi:hypothetical protein
VINTARISSCRTARFSRIGRAPPPIVARSHRRQVGSGHHRDDGRRNTPIRVPRQHRPNTRTLDAVAAASATVIGRPRLAEQRAKVKT